MNRARWTAGLLALVAGCGTSAGRTDAAMTDDAALEAVDGWSDPADVRPDAEAPHACTLIPPVVLDHARLTVDEATGRLRDALGRDVVMRGINAGGRAKWAPFLPFPIAPEADIADVRAAAVTFFSRLHLWGLDTVRLTFSWEALEPARGQVDERYRDRFEALVDAAWQERLRVVVDNHQDLFASPLCGDGFPPWALPATSRGPPRHDCTDWALHYVTDARVGEAFDRFWANADGIQDAFRAMWDLLAARLRDHPGVAAFEVLNEPGWGTHEVEAFKKDVLTPFHAAMAARLREVAPEVLVVYDNPGIDAVSPLGASYPRPEGEGLVFGPHYYDIGLFNGGDWSGLAPEDVIARMASFRDANGVPVLLGEFGYAGGAGQGAAEWLTRLMDALDDARLSATLWEYSINEELWNGEDMSVVTAQGQERPVLEVYVRPWLRAVAGTDASFRWDAGAGLVEAAWTSSGGVTEVVAPVRLFPDGPVDLSLEGDGACATWDPERGEVRVRAPAGVAVRVTFRR